MQQRKVFLVLGNRREPNFPLSSRSCLPWRRPKETVSRLAWVWGSVETTVETTGLDWSPMDHRKGTAWQSKCQCCRTTRRHWLVYATGLLHSHSSLAAFADAPWYVYNESAQSLRHICMIWQYKPCPRTFSRLAKPTTVGLPSSSGKQFRIATLYELIWE